MQTSEFDSSDEEPIEDEQTPIQISWLPLSRVNCSQFLGLCALPVCKFENVRRNIQKDTEELKSYGIQTYLFLHQRGTVKIQSSEPFGSLPSVWNYHSSSSNFRWRDS